MVNFFGFLLVFLLSSWASAASDLGFADSDFGCIPKTKAEQFTDDYSIDVASFGGPELCNSQVDTKKLFNDLLVLEGGQFANGGRNLLITGLIAPEKYYSWMKEQTRSIQRGNDIPYATAYNSFGNFTMQDAWAVMPILGRVGVVVHEARHTEGYSHTQCTLGPYQGSRVSGCDRNYAQGGSHAVEMEYYARVTVTGSNYHPIYKSMARLMAMARANMVFNQPILQKREGLLAIDSNHKAFLYDKGQWYERELPQKNGILKRTSAGAVILDGSEAYTIEMYQTTGALPTLSDFYSYFKLLGQRRGHWADLEEVDIGARRFVVALSADNKAAVFNFPAGDWSSAKLIPAKVSRTATMLENGEEGMFFVADTGDIFPYDPLNQTLGSAKSFQWPSDLTSVAKVDGKVLSLRKGKIFVAGGKQWVPWAPAAQSDYTSMVNVPLYDAFEVLK